MNFIALLISYFFQQKLDLSLSDRFDQFSLGLLRPEQFSLMAKSSYAAFGVLLLILTAYFSFFQVLFFYLEHLLLGVPSLLSQIVLLLLLLGQNGFKDSLKLYLMAWNRGDFEAAAFNQQALSGVNALRLSDPVTMQNEVSKALLYHTFNRFFVIIFWFMVAGPAAAVVVRITDLIAEHSSHQLMRVAAKVKMVVEWLPARLLALSFAFTGDFKGAITGSLKYFGDLSSGAADVLCRSASNALNSFDLSYVVDHLMDRKTLISRGDKGIEGIRGLLSRSMALWLGVFAVIAIMGW